MEPTSKSDRPRHGARFTQRNIYYYYSLLSSSFIITITSTKSTIISLRAKSASELPAETISIGDSFSNKRIDLIVLRFAIQRDPVVHSHGSMIHKNRSRLTDRSCIAREMSTRLWLFKQNKSNQRVKATRTTATTTINKIESPLVCKIFLSIR